MPSKINKLMYAGVFGATVLMSGASAFAQDRDYNHGGFFNNNNRQPNQYYQNYYQNFFPQMNWGRKNQNSQNNYHGNNNYRDNNYLTNCNNEQYVDRQDMEASFDINRDGGVIIRNAVVNSVNGNNVSLTSNLGRINLNWTLVLDNQTQFESRNGRGIDRREITVGDRITVKGTLMSGSSLTVNADMIRNTLRSNQNYR